MLVGLDIHNEHQSVVLLDLLHCTLCVERVNDDFMVIESGFMRNRLAGVFWRSTEDEGLWSVECSGEAGFASFFCMDLFKR